MIRVPRYIGEPFFLLAIGTTSNQRPAQAILDFCLEQEIMEPDLRRYEIVVICSARVSHELGYLPVVGRRD